MCKLCLQFYSVHCDFPLHNAWVVTCGDHHRFMTTQWLAKCVKSQLCVASTSALQIYNFLRLVTLQLLLAWLMFKTDVGATPYEKYLRIEYVILSHDIVLMINIRWSFVSLTMNDINQSLFHKIILLHLINRNESKISMKWMLFA